MTVNGTDTITTPLAKMKGDKPETMKMGYLTKTPMQQDLLRGLRTSLRMLGETTPISRSTNSLDRQGPTPENRYQMLGITNSIKTLTMTPPQR